MLNNLKYSENEDGESFEEERIIEYPPEITKPEPNDYFKQRLYEKLMNKPLGQLNCCYTFVENFYAPDLNITNLSYLNVSNEMLQSSGFLDNRSFHMRANDSKKLLLPSFKKPNGKLTEKEKFSITQHENYRISILECVCEQMTQNNHYGKFNQDEDKTIEQQNKEKFYRLYYSLKNIVKNNCFSKPNKEIEKITKEVLEQCVSFMADKFCRLKNQKTF